MKTRKFGHVRIFSVGVKTYLGHLRKAWREFHPLAIFEVAATIFVVTVVVSSPYLIRSGKAEAKLRNERIGAVNKLAESLDGQRWQIGGVNFSPSVPCGEGCGWTKASFKVFGRRGQDTTAYQLTVLDYDYVMVGALRFDSQRTPTYVVLCKVDSPDESLTSHLKPDWSQVYDSEH